MRFGSLPFFSPLFCILKVPWSVFHPSFHIGLWGDHKDILGRSVEYSKAAVLIVAGFAPQKVPASFLRMLFLAFGLLALGVFCTLKSDQELSPGIWYFG